MEKRHGRCMGPKNPWGKVVDEGESFRRIFHKLAVRRNRSRNHKMIRYRVRGFLPHSGDFEKHTKGE